MFQHRLGVSVGDEERNIISLRIINICTDQRRLGRFKVGTSDGNFGTRFPTCGTKRDWMQQLWISPFRGVECTLMGFLRNTMKLSARCIRNRVNLWQSIRSISSACLILMLTRIELTEGSIRTRSFSFRDIVKGFSRTSFDPLRTIRQRGVTQDVVHSRDFHLGLIVTLDDLRRRL